jgi:hypothetical protein
MPRVAAVMVLLVTGALATITTAVAGAARWTIEPTANPSATDSADLDGVWCAGLGACTAVGSGDDADGSPGTLAERVRRGGWVIQRTPAYSDPLRINWGGVSCLQSTICVAVRYAAGDPDGPAGDAVAFTLLAARWNGRRWSAQRIPTPIDLKDIDEQLMGVSCPERRFCLARPCTSASRSGTRPHP